MRLSWDNIGERYFELGVDHGVLYDYVDGEYTNGVTWNGLSAMSVGPTGSTAYDGKLYRNRIKTGIEQSFNEYNGKINCYTYPDEFEKCIGYQDVIPGMLFSQQDRPLFGVSYRSKIGNDVDGPDKGYKIHLVYNCLVVTNDGEYETISDEFKIAELIFDIETFPVENSYTDRPSSEIILDSRKLTTEQLELVESILYGSNEAEPRLPYPDELVEILTSDEEEDTDGAPTATTADGAYGVEWDYSQSSTNLTRKGLATSFESPTPATSNNTVGTSPFDDVMPWKGMKRYNVINGAIGPSEDENGFDETNYDTVVYIPEFYYTAYKDTTNQKWLWAISPTKLNGYKKHPGSGRYIGRFHTSGDSTEVFSKSGVSPLVNTSQTDFRTYSKNKGTGWYMLDLATWSALQMLYLVEFANFDSQTILGTGYDTGSLGSCGGTTGAQHHTIKASHAHNQYRWVEDPWSNCRDWIDGFIGSRSSVYVGLSNNSFDGTTSNLTQATGLVLPSNGYITGYGYSEETAWAFIPDTVGDSTSTFVPDYLLSYSSQSPACVGGSYYFYQSDGLFYFNANFDASGASGDLGSRLIYIP